MPLFLPSDRLQVFGRRGADVAPYTFVPEGATLVDIGGGQAVITANSGGVAHRGPGGQAVRFSGGGISGTPGVAMDFDVGVSGIIVFSPDTALAKASLISLTCVGGTYQFALNSSGGIQVDRQAAANVFTTSDLGIRANGVVHCAGFQAIAGGNTTATLNGRVIATATLSVLTGGISALHIARRAIDLNETLTGKVYGVFLFPYSIGAGRLCAYTANPRLLVGSRRVWVPVSAGGSHAASGDLASDAAAIAGTAAHLTLHATSGALASDAAAIAGTATHLTLHAASGALAADASSIAGTADHAVGGEHPADGALSADAATIAGAAAHLTLHATTGALAADAGALAGAAAHTGPGAASPMTGAGRPSRTRRPRVVEIDGEDFVVNSAEEAAALLERAREHAKALAATAVKRASEARRRPVRKVIQDARRLLETPDIKAPDDLQPLVQQAQSDIAATYASALASVEIAALLAKRQREEEDDEDVLLLIA